MMFVNKSVLGGTVGIQYKQYKNFLLQNRGKTVYTIALLFLACFVWSKPAEAIAGINEQLSYQARLLDSTGGVVPDGNYNLRFKVYQDGDGILGGGDETLKWTETRDTSNRVAVKNGYFSVQLGSATAFNTTIDWGQNTLWLSLEVGGTNISPTWDGEMSPFRRLTSSAYALNAKQLGGLDASRYLQASPAAVQADSTTSSTIFINKTGASGNIVQLQKAGADVMTLGNTGALLLKNTVDSASALKVVSSSNVDTFSVNTSANQIQIGNATADATGVVLVLDSKNTSGDPSGINGSTYYNSSTGKFRCFEAGVWKDCINSSSGSSGIPLPNSRRSTTITYPGSGTAWNIVGDVATGTGTATAIAADATMATRVNYATTTTNGNTGGISGNAIYRRDRNILFQAYVQPNATTNTRLWVGLTDQTAATMGASSNPAGNYAAFRWDTSVGGETTWKCVTKDGTTQNIQLSGVTISATAFKLEIVGSASNFIFKINGTTVCTNSTNLPGTVNLRYVLANATNAAAATNVRYGWGYIESDL